MNGIAVANRLSTTKQRRPSGCQVMVREATMAVTAQVLTKCRPHGKTKHPKHIPLRTHTSRQGLAYLVSRIHMSGR